MSSANERYDAAAAKYEQMNDKLWNGEAYRNSTKEAQQTAGGIAADRGAQAAAAARQAGYSKAQAAEMGANVRANSYSDALQNQQGMALGTKTNAVGNQGQVAANEMQEGSNRYNKAWGNFGAGSSAVGGILQAFSDENLKDAKQNNTSSDAESIIHKHLCKKHLLEEIRGQE